MALVYLAGPINGCNDEEALGWRRRVRAAVESSDLSGGYVVVDPAERDFRGDEDNNWKSIVEDDLADIARCAYFLANCWKPSIGTAMELREAWSGGACTIVVKAPPVSPWLRYHARVLVSTVDEAIDFLLRNAPR